MSKIGSGCGLQIKAQWQSFACRQRKKIGGAGKAGEQEGKGKGQRRARGNQQGYKAPHKLGKAF